MEIWKDIEGYEGLYQVSNEGRIKSLERDVPSISHGKPCLRHLQESIMEAVKNRGYEHVRLWINGEYATYAIHRLVYETFIGKIPKDKEIDHINTIRNDNRVENLRCVSHKENQNNPLTIINSKEAHNGKHVGELNGMYGKKHSIATKQKIKSKAIGRKHSEKTKQKMSEKRKGENNGMFGKKNVGASNKLSKNIIEFKSDGTFKEWKSATEASLYYGYANSGNISNCCNGKYMRLGNHFFKKSYWFFKNADSL